MNIIPNFEIGLFNAWIFMIWTVISPFISFRILNDKKISKISFSVKIKHEKLLNILSMSAIIFGFIYSIFIPLLFNSIFFLIGLLLFIFGFIFDVTAMLYIKKIDYDKPFTGGPYKYSRHPLYLALIMIIIGIFLMTLNWLYLLIMLICIFHILIVVPSEEKYCLVKYGKKYHDYINKTPRWFGLPK
jgi:protein-S-isoprenylcysteine O-methyltransferase Ste14